MALGLYLNHRSQGFWLANTIAAKNDSQGNSQGQLIKKPWVEEPKAWSFKSSTAPQHSNNSQSSVKGKQDKKNDQRHQNQW